MEIESKFLVTEEADFQALENLSGLASYALSEAKLQQIEDIFLILQIKLLWLQGTICGSEKSMERMAGG
ncbi:MAG: hypothetical protein NHB15_07425 [Methanosarcina barkeri]|nr:hypothetical protein [Methanosarcina sp. ERenArc_MAG2]